MLVLIRHGESTGNAAGLLLGRTDAALTPKGRHQAAAAAVHLGAVHQVISSPLERARDTAALLGLGCPLTVDPRWVEVDYGDHEGQALSAVPAEVWTRWRADPGYRPPGGESLAEVSDRVDEACRELFATPGSGARAAGGDVVVVSHVSPIKAAVAWALAADPSVAWRLHLSTGAVTRIGWGADAPVLHTFNQAEPLVPEPPGGS